MKGNTSIRWRLLTGLIVAVAVATLTPAWAGNNGKTQDGEGKYANLSALWWEWILTAPTKDVDGNNTNPVLDSTGEYANVGQENGQGPGNKYFFLCGSFGVVTERTVTVPHGKALFFPIVDWEWDNAVDPPTNYTVPQLRALIKPLVDDALSEDMSATLDGEPIEILRTKSPTFQYTVPKDDSLYDWLGLTGSQFEGTIKPAVADGLWCYIAPLAPGEYELHFTFSDFQDNTYHLTVE